ncbi:MAG: porphobilinogen synthase [Armatimonadetes bacterium]|nr:porphobilinogen synthase [Armatimonadota bacterium]
MPFPSHRPRRLRRTPALRRLVRETTLSPSQFIYPIFVTEEADTRREISSMPGQFQLSLEHLSLLADRASELGIGGLLLFGIPLEKDPLGTGAYTEDGIVQRACEALKRSHPDLLLVTDLCLCEYTSHGHCGELDEAGCVRNDETLKLLAKGAVAQARAGADVIAPSDMMDGRVGAIRRALDDDGFSHLPIMSYAAKYASAFYGPFRDAAGSTPQFGDRQAYQMDPGNAREAIREMELDVEEGADMLMVKPGLAYLDILHEARRRFDLPLAVYNVSGEYAMVKAAARNGWLDERRIVLETLTAMRRAGADILITYHALEAAEWLT